MIKSVCSHYIDLLTYINQPQFCSALGHNFFIVEPVDQLNCRLLALRNSPLRFLVVAIPLIHRKRRASGLPLGYW